MACLGMADLSHREARVLAVLAYHDGPGGCSPSLDRIAAECGMLRGRVAETLAALCVKGRLERTPGRSKGRGKGREPNRYRVDYKVPETRDCATELQRPGNRPLQRPGFPGREPEGNRKEEARDADNCRTPQLCTFDGKGCCVACGRDFSTED